MEQGLSWDWHSPQKIEHSSEKLGSFFCFIIISTIYKFLSSKIYKIINRFCYWLCCKFANKVIMFQEALQFCFAIVLCYSKQTIVKVSG
jgi:hypothetical protein